MATHFARGILTEGHLISVRLPSQCHQEARNIPPHRQSRFLASRGLLAELMFMLYGIGELPEIVTLPKGKPVFSDKNLPSFSISYAGNMVGVALTTEGECGLDMELQRATRGFHSPHAPDNHTFSSNESLWISKQNDPNEARAQLITLRRSVLKLTGDVLNDDPRDLQLLPIAGRLKCAHVNHVEALCDAKERYDWVLIDAPAGVGAGFELAIRFADELVVVCLADPASQRDAARAAELALSRRDVPARLVVNRVSPRLFQKMNATIDDIMDGVGLPLLGIVPDDADVTLAAVEGKPLCQYTFHGAGLACLHIAQRLQGKRVKLMKIRRTLAGM